MSDLTPPSRKPFTLQGSLRTLHVVVTTQFFFAAAVIILYFLFRSAPDLWALFPLSAQGLVLLVLVVLVYAFAVARGVVGERDRDEHPFTGYYPYRIFYLILPVLGGVGGGILYLLSEGLIEGLLGAALGTVLPACAVWLAIDPLIGIIESLLPRARHSRRLRKQREKERQRERRRRRDDLIEELKAQRVARLKEQEPFLKDHAVRMAALLADTGGDLRERADAAGLIGLEAWQTGGPQLMKELARRALALLSEPLRQKSVMLLDDWWDTVGDGRSAPFASPDLS